MKKRGKSSLHIKKKSPAKEGLSLEVELSLSTRAIFAFLASIVLLLGFFAIRDFTEFSVGKAYSVAFRGQEFAESVEINLLANVPEKIEFTVDSIVKTALLEFTGSESELAMDINGIGVSSTRRASDEGVNIDAFDATAQINSYCLK